MQGGAGIVSHTARVGVGPGRPASQAEMHADKTGWQPEAVPAAPAGGVRACDARAVAEVEHGEGGAEAAQLRQAPPAAVGTR